MLRSWSNSEKNFAVHLLRHFFLPSEYVRDVGKKLPLNTEKIQKIREIVFKYFPSSDPERLWRDCRKAIDAYLRNRKVSETRSISLFIIIFFHFKLVNTIVTE